MMNHNIETYLQVASPENKGACNDERSCGACFSDQGDCENNLTEKNKAD